MGQLEDIEMFVRIVEAGGIGRAADQLGLAKSAVSRRLAELENRLEIKLMNRTTRKLGLTEAGSLYYERALSVIDSVAEMNHLTARTDSTLEGTLRLAAPMSFGLEHLSPVLDAFARENPQLNIEIDFSDREVDMVEEGFDLAFRIGDLKDSSIQARKIAPIRFVICASPGYLEAHGEPTDLASLEKHRLLRYGNMPRNYWRLIDSDGKEHAIQLNNSQISANNGHFLLNMAKAGHGIILQPTFIAWQALANHELVPILTDYKVAPTFAYAVYPQNRFLSHKARVLIDFLVERFGGNAYWDQANDL